MQGELRFLILVDISKVARRSQLIQAPQLYRQGLTEERHTTWLETFFDLVIAAAITAITTRLMQNFSFNGLIEFSLFYVPVWWAWVGIAFYSTRFKSDDLIHRLITMCQMGAVAFMAFSIQKGLEQGSIGFAMGYVSFRTLLIVQYIRAGASISEARKMAYGYAGGFIVAALIWVGSCFVPPPFRYFLWILAIAIDLSTPTVFRQAAMKFPPNLTHIPERFGLFTIIVLGEAVVAGITAIKSAHLEFAQYLTAALSLILAFALWWDYFDIVKGAEIDEEALKDGANRFRAWMYLHLPLTATISILAAGLSVAMLLPVGQHLGWDQGWMISCGAGICMFMLGFTWLASPELTEGRTLFQQSVPYILIAAAGVLSGGLVHLVPTPAFIFIFIVLVGLRIARGIRDGNIGADATSDKEAGPSSLSVG